jgi:hypothetical protein
MSSGGGAHFDGQNVTGGSYSINPLTGTPQVSGGSTSTFAALAQQETSTPIDTSLKWTSEFLGKRLLLDVMLGMHYQADLTRAADGSSAFSGPGGLAAYYNVQWSRTMPHSITEFEKFPTANQCHPDAMTDLCPVSNYLTGSPPFLQDAYYHRYHASAIATYLANALGHHLIKAGFDSELTSFQVAKVNRQLDEATDGASFADLARFGALTGPDQADFSIGDPLQKETKSLVVGGFLQDSWSVLDKITLNLGLRYDSQIFYNTEGAVALTLPNQWSPRLGIIFDPTQSGRAKVFANYARYYENAPLDFADVALVGEPQALAAHAAGTCNPLVYAQQRKECLDPASLQPSKPGPVTLPNKIYRSQGGNPNTIDPAIQASSSEELSAGGEYELFQDARVGLTYTKRWINRWIEDVSPAVGLPSFDANPGFGLAANYPKISRDYDAATLFLMKNFSHSWLAQVSYTVAYLRGNYAGLVRPETSDLLPNFGSDYDERYIETNRTGPLPGDTRHVVKVIGSREWELTPLHHLNTGVVLRTQSGGATSYLGKDPNGYPGEIYILPRGAGERLPWTYNADVQLAYRFAMSKAVTLSATVDVFNVVNSQRITSVNQQYTLSDVYPTAGAKKADLDKLTAADGTVISKSRIPSFGQASSYQEPRVFRFGLRGQF